MTSNALIITLKMDDAATARFTALRKLHFPAHRNWLDAHVTLFHALPPTALDDVLHDTAQKASQTSAFPMMVDRVLFLGQGVAYAISSVEGMRLRHALADCWNALLVRQDRMWHGPLHVTVQNKVDPAVAKKLQAELVRDFAPHSVQAAGLEVWKYRGGPWEHVATMLFKPPTFGLDPIVG